MFNVTHATNILQLLRLCITIKNVNMKVHMNYHNAVICNFCGKKLTQKSHLKSHISAVHEKLKPYKCNLCEETFSQKNALIKHKMLVHDHNVQKCNICEIEIKGDANILKMHISRVHERAGQSMCTFCNKYLKSKRALDIHLRTVHENDKQKPFKCELCQRYYSYLESLRLHIKKAIKSSRTKN